MRRANTISLVKIDLCRTRTVQHTFETTRFHLFLRRRRRRLLLPVSSFVLLCPIISLNLIHLLPMSPSFRTRQYNKLSSQKDIEQSNCIVAPLVRLSRKWKNMYVEILARRDLSLNEHQQVTQLESLNSLAELKRVRAHRVSLRRSEESRASSTRSLARSPFLSTNSTRRRSKYEERWHYWHLSNVSQRNIKRKIICMIIQSPVGIELNNI